MNQLLNTVQDPMLFSEVEEKNLQFRLRLMLVVLAYIKKKGFTEEQIDELGVKPTAIRYLLQRKVGLLNTDDLLNMLEHCDFNIYAHLSDVIHF